MCIQFSTVDSRGKALWGADFVQSLCVDSHYGEGYSYNKNSTGGRKRMIDLKKFYFQYVQESDYHYRFYDDVKSVNVAHNVFYGPEERDDHEFEVYDTEEAISKFRELCQPEQLDCSEMTFGFLSDAIVKKYRKQIQCFRHASENSVEERKKYSNAQKEFLVNFGLTIVNVIVSLLKQV